MPITHSFRDLRAWQEGILLVSDAYRVARALPATERYSLGDQLRRAAVSVVANIAEGHGRPRTNEHRRDYRRFVGVALGSLAELETHLIVAEREQLASHELISSAMQRVPRARLLLCALHNAL